jgi:hypothetical protein
MIFALCTPDTRFSQVCAAWRTLAINTPCLWTTINFGSSWALPALECLRRAQDSLLAVRFGEQFMLRNHLDPLGPCLDAYVAKSSHVRTLEINCYNVRTAEHILRRHAPAPPELVELHIRVHCLDNSECSFDNSAAELAEEDEPSALALGPDLFGGAAPRLRTLFLTQVTIDPSWPPYSHLRDVCIEGGSISAETALRLFAAMPLLEDFYAHRLIDGEDLDVATTERIKLPRLRKCEIQDYHVPCVAAVLRHLSLPPDVILTVRCTSGQAEEAQVHDLLHALSPHLAASRGRFAASAIEIEVDYFGSHLRAADSPDETPWITFCFDMDVSLLASTFRAHLPFDGVKRLHVPSERETYTLGREAWETILPSMPHIESVLVHEAHAPTLCEALIASSSEALPCPRLRQLALAPFYDVHKTLESGCTLLELIADAMGVRRNLGVPITTLQLEETRMDDARAICVELSQRGIDLEIIEDDVDECVDEDVVDEGGENEEDEGEEFDVQEFLRGLHDDVPRRRLLKAHRN